MNLLITFMILYKLNNQVFFSREIFILFGLFFIIFNNLINVVAAAESSVVSQSVGSDSESEIFCSICLVQTNLDFVTRCNHSYCSPCIIIWTEKRLVCPICEGTISNNINLEYFLLQIVPAHYFIALLYALILVLLK